MSPNPPSLPSLLLRPQLPASATARLSQAEITTDDALAESSSGRRSSFASPARAPRTSRLRRPPSVASLAQPTVSTASSSSALATFSLPADDRDKQPTPSSSRLASPAPTSAELAPAPEPVPEVETAAAAPAPTPASPVASPTPTPAPPAEDQPASEPDSDASAASDISSDFAGLLTRVGRKPDPARLKSAKARGKERAADQDSLDDGEAVNRTAFVPSPEDQDAEGQAGEEEDADEEGEVVLRTEGLSGVDPREMLRKQLARGAGGGVATSPVRPRGSRMGTGVTTDSASVRHLDPPALAPAYPPRRYFVLSSAGKLIFTTDPEEEATTLVGVMQAIISIFADEGDRIRYIDAGGTKIGFLLKAPLYLCCVSSWGEPESILRLHLLHLHMLILSLVTLSQLTAIFARRANFDLRRMLEGTDPFFDKMLARLQAGLGEMTASLEVYRLEPTLREDVAKALGPCKIQDTLYALVISSGRIVTLLRPKKHTIHPSDLHLLLCHLPEPSSSATATADASWIPICLPRFNPRGFLHAYVSWATERTCVVMVCGDREAVGKAREWGEGVKERLRAVGKDGKKGKGGANGGSLLERVERGRVGQVYSLAELAVPGLRHFVYKAKAYVQITHPAFEGDYDHDDHRNRLVTLYQHLHDDLHPRPAYSGSARPPAKLVYLRTEHEAVLGWTTSSFELYLAVSPLLPKNAVVSAARAVTRWVKKNDSSLFLTSAHSL